MLKLPITYGNLSQLQSFLELGYINSEVILAGGSLRTLFDQKDKIQDYDIYFLNLWMSEENQDIGDFFTPSGAQISVDHLKSQLLKDGFTCVFACPEGKLFTYKRGKMKVQLICEKFYNSIDDVINDFDVTPCLLATDGKFLYTYRKTIRDIRNKRINLFNLQHPVSTFKRIMKYHYAKKYKLGNVIEQYLEAYKQGVMNSREWDMRRYVD